MLYFQPMVTIICTYTFRETWGEISKLRAPLQFHVICRSVTRPRRYVQAIRCGLSPHMQRGLSVCLSVTIRYDSRCCFNMRSKAGQERPRKNWQDIIRRVGLPDLPYFTGDPVFQTLSPASPGGSRREEQINLPYSVSHIVASLRRHCDTWKLRVKLLYGPSIRI